MNRKILRLAIPNIIASVTVPLLGLVDLFIVGHLSSELFIGAIGLATMIFNFVYWNFSFLRMGTSGFTAQAFGAEDRRETVNVLLRSMSVAVVAGLAIILLQRAILWGGLTAGSIEGASRRYVSEYFTIYIWSAPAVLGIFAFNGWFTGMQDAKTPMFISIGINVVNIAGSLFLVFVLGWEIRGVALGSLIAQYAGLAAFGLALRWRYRGLLRFAGRGFARRWADFAPFFRVNRDIYLRTLCLITVTTFFTSASARISDNTLAVNSLIMQTFILFSYMMDGFAHAGEALTGRFAGAGDPVRLRLLIRRLFGWGLSLTAVFTIGYYFFAGNLLRLLTDKENVVAQAEDYFFWVTLIPAAGFSAFIWDGIYIGLTASVAMRNSMFLAMVVFFVIYYTLFPVWGNDALWLAFISYLATRGLAQTFFFPRIGRKFGL